jgi:hypothetical protein
LVLKNIIKDQIPAKLKFYTLLLLKELLESDNKFFIDSFKNILIDRLAIIANFPGNPSQCLDFYYNNCSEENKKYSAMFYELLLECWKNWDYKYSKDHKKFKKKSNKIRIKFPQN